MLDFLSPLPKEISQFLVHTSATSGQKNSHGQIKGIYICKEHFVLVNVVPGMSS